MAAIEIRGLVKYFGQSLVLDRIDLDVAKGETVALIGASGSGKSTLLRCLNRIVEPDHGSVTIDGIPLEDRRFAKGALQRQVGIVFQSYNLFPHMRVIDNLTLAPRKVLKLPRKQAEAEALEMLHRFGLSEHARSWPEQLSGGQQQRVAIARAMATQPGVLLLDEVTAALDPELVGEVLDVIRDLKARGQTMVVVTHEMGFARAVADRICFLDGGRIVEAGPPERLLDAPEHPRTKAFLARLLR